MARSDLVFPSFLCVQIVTTGVPRKVSLILSYYQRTATSKRVISAEIGLDDYESPENTSATGNVCAYVYQYLCMYTCIGRGRCESPGNTSATGEVIAHRASQHVWVFVHVYTKAHT